MIFSHIKYNTLLIVVLIATALVLAACADNGDSANDNGGNGKDATYAFVCPNGTAAAGATAETDGDTKCASCNTGYRQVGDACALNRYVCTNGTAITATGNDKPDDDNTTQKCLECKDGYFVNSEAVCQQGIAYLCDNGVPATGQAPAANTTKCAQCDHGYSLASDACSLSLVGLWQFATSDTCANGSCFVSMTDGGAVSWIGNCPADASPYAPSHTTSFQIDTVDNNPTGLIFNTPGPLHDYTVDRNGTVFVLNPHSSTQKNTTRYLCVHSGLSPLVATTIGLTSATISVTPSHSGTLYWVLYADDANAPTAAHVVNGANDSGVGVARIGATAQSVTANITTTFMVSGDNITALTDYDLYAVLAATVNGTNQQILSDKYDLQTAGCDEGYRIDGDSCAFNRYICDNGTPVAATANDKPTTDKNVEKCVSGSCSDGFVFENDTCRQAVYICSVTNRQPIAGNPSTGNADVEQCGDCETGYRLVGESCELNRYICPKGTPVAATANDKPATDNEVEKCSGCTAPYHLSSANECSFMVETHTDGTDVTGYTLKCSDAELGDSADIDLDGDGTSYSSITYVKRSQQQILNDTDKSDAATSCTSDITDMSNFLTVDTFNGDVSHWDTSSVNKMTFLFNTAEAFNHDIGNWDVSSVTNMDGMFRRAGTFNQDISSWDVSAVSSMLAMFTYASDFDQDISGWCVQIHFDAEPQEIAVLGGAYDAETSDDWEENEKPDWDGDPANNPNCPSTP